MSQPEEENVNHSTFMIDNRCRTDQQSKVERELTRLAPKHHLQVNVYVGHNDSVMNMHEYKGV